ncbi:MAG: hypothetical protein AAF805_03275 [Planctomycetota bacterium]
MTTPAEESDDADYELAPIDPAVLAHERRLAAEEVAAASRRVNVDEVYTRGATPTISGSATREVAIDGPRYRLSTVLLATTALAVVAGLWVSNVSLGLTFAGTIGLSLVVLCCAHAWSSWSEARHRARAEHELDARRRGVAPDEDWVAEDWRALLRLARDQAGLRFTISGLLSLTTFVACLGVLTTVVSVPVASALLGMASLAGFVAMAADIPAPKPLVTAWWLSVAGYVALSAASFFISP